MNAVRRNQLLSLELYERLRPVLRPLCIAEKDRRRLTIGEHLTLLFENTQTVWYQVQEILRSEKIIGEAAIAHELDTYNELLPGPNQLAATLLLQFENFSERDAQLRKLAGLEKHLWFVNGERRQAAIFDLRQMNAERVSSVHFVKFPLGGLDSAEFIALANQGQLAIEVSHPELRIRGPIRGPLAIVLSSDLS